MGTKLSHFLIDLGFFSVLGTTEHVGGGGQGTLVKRGQPFTHDYNNGVTVVYDENGCPWIRRGHVSTDEFVIWNGGPIVRGAHVPHSNDGGYFVREVMPKL